MFVLDSEQRLLLVHERRDIGSSETIWITPGGGVEALESLTETATREVYDEAGRHLRLADSASAVCVEWVTFRLAGTVYDQPNRYFLARVPAGTAVHPAAHTDIERLLVLGHRWWSFAELRASDALREPTAIVEVVEKALARECRRG